MLRLLIYKNQPMPLPRTAVLIVLAFLATVHAADRSPNADLTEAGLIELKQQPELKRLNLSASKITNAGLSHLKDCAT